MKRILFLVLLMCGLTPWLQAQYYGVDKEFEKNFSIGLKLGTAMVLGDVDVDLPGSFELGLNLQKVLARPIDFRVQVNYGQAYGANTTPSSGILFNNSLNGVGFCSKCTPNSVAYDTLNPKVYHNFRMRYYDASFQLKLNINRLFTKEGGENWDLYVFAGFGTLLYSTFYNAADANGQPYNYSQITETDADQVRTLLTEMRDDTYETFAQQDVRNKVGFGFYGLSASVTGGAGFRIKLSEKLAVGLEARYNYTRDDLLDGQQWNDDNTLTSDLDALVSGGITFDYILPVK